MQCDKKHPHSSSDFFLHHLILLVLSTSEVSATGYRTVDREDGRSRDAGSSFFSGWTVDRV